MNNVTETCDRCGELSANLYIYADERGNVLQACVDCWVIGLGYKKDE